MISDCVSQNIQLMLSTTDKHIKFYMSIFRGRDDIYARRWERDEKSGYYPAYHFDWNEFKAHKAKGGTIKTFENN